ncbi:MAG: rhodanese-like domain-containing protein [Sodalis sp. (in: enterobacteria)]
MQEEILQFIAKHTMLSLAWVVLLSSVIVITFQIRLSKVREILQDEAINLINKENALIVDLRNQADYRKGHIVNSLNLATVDIKSGNLGELRKAKDKQIIVVCTKGISSHASAKKLIKAGFKRVYVLKEGISGWITENLPLIQSK